MYVRNGPPFAKATEWHGEALSHPFHKAQKIPSSGIIRAWRNGRDSNPRPLP
jgi:hypothetical protein